jgi:uncharacterized protein YndB with AHSA1/START domain
MKQQVSFELFYPHPPERVWRALTDPEALKRWLMPSDFRPQHGHRFRFTQSTEREPGDRNATGVVRCEVVELQEPSRLVYTWQSERDPEPTLVTWTLEPVEGGTRLHLEHTALNAPLTMAFRAEAQINWSHALDVILPAITHVYRQRGRILPADRLAPARGLALSRALKYPSIGPAADRPADGFCCHVCRANCRCTRETRVLADRLAPARGLRRLSLPSYSTSCIRIRKEICHADR